MSRRNQQVASTLRRAISQILVRKVSDPRIRGLVSVTNVDLSDNYREATIFVTVIPEQYISRTIHGLNSGAGMFQSELAKTMTIRAIPKLKFKHDEGVKKENDIFDEIQRGLDREGLTPADVAKQVAETEAVEGAQDTTGDIGGELLDEDSHDTEATDQTDSIEPPEPSTLSGNDTLNTKPPQAETEHPSASSTENTTP